jgi:hypothetical protein
MKKDKSELKSQASRPQRFLLQMVRKGEDWAGRAVCFSWDEEYRFESLEDLREWLNQHDKGGSGHSVVDDEHER